MDGNFANRVGIVRNTASALVGRVDSVLGRVGWSIDPLVLDARCGVQLASREEFHVTMKEAIEWKVD